VEAVLFDCAFGPPVKVFDLLSRGHAANFLANSIADDIEFLLKRANQGLHNPLHCQQVKKQKTQDEGMEIPMRRDNDLKISHAEPQSRREDLIILPSASPRAVPLQ
jgi:hypothetical protein